MAKRSIVVQNKDMLGEALRSEKAPEVKRKLSFLSLVAGGREVKEAATHFGICFTTGYNWIHRWNSEGIEGLKPKSIPGRPSGLSDRCAEGIEGHSESKTLLGSQGSPEAHKGTLWNRLLG